MILVFHVVVASMSMLVTLLTVYAPTQIKLYMAFVLTLSTLLSGALLLVMESVSIARACISGGMYFVLMISLIVIARKRFDKAFL